MADPPGFRHSLRFKVEVILLLGLGLGFQYGTEGKKDSIFISCREFLASEVC